MGSLVRGLLRNSPPFRVISSFSVKPTNPSPEAIPHLLSHLQPISPDNEQSKCNLSPNGESSAQFKLQSPVFPSFPFGFLPDLIHSSGILDAVPEVEDVERSEDASTIWADSVKKKRKRKMNKHKLKKLRKLLRRKT